MKEDINYLKYISSIEDAEDIERERFVEFCVKSFECSKVVEEFCTKIYFESNGDEKSWYFEHHLPDGQIETYGYYPYQVSAALAAADYLNVLEDMKIDLKLRDGFIKEYYPDYDPQRPNFKGALLREFNPYSISIGLSMENKNRTREIDGILSKFITKNYGGNHE